MVYGIFALAVALLACGHYFRALRWRQLIGIYEDPPRELLVWSLATGYTVNFFLPLRMGDFARAVLLGRKLENGFALALSTTIIDYGFDVPVVCLIFLALRLLAPDNAALGAAFRWYLLFTLILVVLFALIVALNKTVKQLVKKVCSVFNEHIEFSLLFFLWTCIVSVKDVYRSVSRRRLLANTLVMWTLYLCSYGAIAAFIAKTCQVMTLSDVIVTLFSPASLGGSLSGNVSGQGMRLWFSLYMLATLAVLLGASALMLALRRRRAGATAQTPVHKLLPQIQESDRLEFLDLYFSGEKHDFINKYIELNRDVSVLQNLSGGSYATTLLCVDTNGTFYRKYAFSKDCAKLREQVEWIERHRGALPLPQITGVREGDGYYCYDMKYDAAAVNYFNFIHSSPHEDSLRVLTEVLEAARGALYDADGGVAPDAAVGEYIQKKVTDNLEKLDGAKALRALTGGDTIVINGRSYRNLPAIRRYLAPERLAQVFRGTPLSDIHGDLTVDNIVCYSDARAPDYYIIDPNSGNILDSPYLDYAKLLQSLHGNYEFYMRTPSARTEHGGVTFVFTRSASYQYLYGKYKDYLFERFSREEVRAIYYHEIVHWLRLLPYKLVIDEARAPIFYAGFIIAANDILDMFEREDGNETRDL